MNVYVKSKFVYVLIGLTVMAMIIWIIAGTRETESENNIPVNQETYTVEASVHESSGNTLPEASGYYMVKYDGESVKVYWIDSSGEHLERETTIAYALLNTEDQEMLAAGIKLDSDEELDGFLENFDS